MVRLMDQSLDSRRDSAFLVDSRSNWTLRGSWPRTLRGPKSGRLAKPRRETPTPQPGPLRNLGKYLECVFFWGDNDEKYVGFTLWWWQHSCGKWPIEIDLIYLLKVVDLSIAMLNYQSVRYPWTTWLVVWNMFNLFVQLGRIPTDSYLLGGVETTNQINIRFLGRLK